MKVIACLDVRANDNGDLVVTKGDQYDVRENTKENEVTEIILIFSIKFTIFRGFLIEHMPRYKWKLLFGLDN